MENGSETDGVGRLRPERNGRGTAEEGRCAMIGGPPQACGEEQAEAPSGDGVAPSQVAFHSGPEDRQ
ncbi:MAG: hypothetical protein ABGY24_01650 [bacterium]